MISPKSCSAIILVAIVILTVTINVSTADERDDYQGLSKQKFRIQQLNVIWDEALKHLKGQKLKNLMTELKAHEKAVLLLKKKREIPDEEEGGSLKTLQSKNLKWIDESVNLEQDLENILNRHHLEPSLAHAYKKIKHESKVTNHEDTENHINSVLDINERQKYDEPRVQLLHSKASALASAVLRKHDDDSKEGRRRRKEFEEWFVALEQDLVMLDSRLKKQRWLEDESARLQSAKKGKLNTHSPHDNGETTNGGHFDLADVQKRLKSLLYKITKSEKELNDRMSSRKYQEFPTSRSEGEL